MLWISRFLLKYGCGLALMLTVIVSIKFLIDHCTPDYDYQFFATTIEIPERVCMYIEGWNATAQANAYSSRGEKGLFAERQNFVIEFIEESSSGNFLWIDSLPYLLNSKLTGEKKTKLFFIVTIPPLILIFAFELLSGIVSMIIPRRKEKPASFVSRIVDPEPSFITTQQAAKDQLKKDADKMKTKNAERKDLKGKDDS